MSGGCEGLESLPVPRQGLTKLLSISRGFQALSSESSLLFEKALVAFRNVNGAQWLRKPDRTLLSSLCVSCSQW